MNQPRIRLWLNFVEDIKFSTGGFQPQDFDCQLVHETRSDDSHNRASHDFDSRSVEEAGQQRSSVRDVATLVQYDTMRFFPTGFGIFQFRRKINGITEAILSFKVFGILANFGATCTTGQSLVALIY